MSSTESEPSKKAVAAVPKVVDSVVAGGNVVHADVVATVQKSPVCMHPQGVIDDWTAPSFDKVSFQTTFIASVPKSLTYCWKYVSGFYSLAFWYDSHNKWYIEPRTITWQRPTKTLGG